MAFDILEFMVLLTIVALAYTLVAHLYVIIEFGGLLRDATHLTTLKYSLHSAQLYHGTDKMICAKGDMVGIIAVCAVPTIRYVVLDFVGMRTIPRWSKMHKLIAQKHDELLANTN